MQLPLGYRGEDHGLSHIKALLGDHGTPITPLVTLCNMTTDMKRENEKFTDVKEDSEHVEVGPTPAELLAAEPDPWKTVRAEADEGEEDEHKLTFSKLRKSPVSESLA